MEVLQLKERERSRIEDKISTEIEHMLIAIVGWIKVILKREQEKVTNISDYGKTSCSFFNIRSFCII